ncbi:hypothetical protein CJO66_21800 [Burkholderia ubonensis]|uniref:DUF2029 domain-containing protein n=1 Tax=Burkholderia ubonensis TaxID=101571 RepID=A0AB74DGX3_9BURK|nr:glycosyltransferase family 87 protein [Burkholderia ubonensis]PAJ80611.1 hypothetical protein CJO71_11680 [Burkholderia ubonensis]PAK00999.1 hypothetical protein CJO68_11990 [Burkholderia ubonensis]PAK12966.1 hypothetical protein CJO66_21800 [Burkholderia ubonensis]RQP83461.1 DUF2029 domain-containing protein [Burkholderia ubonensis]RQP90769.1 DUF2029 domain-containing protein [Burkholderia ubonensis]
MQTSPEPNAAAPGRWLTRDRVMFYAGLVLIADLVFLFIRVWGAYVLHHPYFGALGWDFAVFWSASSLSIQHGAASAFDWTLLARIARPLQGSTSNAAALPTPWVYPPPFLLVVRPLAWLPFIWSYIVFLVAGLALAAWSCARIVKARAPAAFWFVALAFPAAWIAGAAGQNSFLTAALMGFGLAALRRRPGLAGVCFGLLAIKPQLAIAIPVALLCGRQWRAFAAAAIAAGVFCVVAGALLGFDTYARFFDSASAFGTYIADRAAMWPTGMPTVFGAARRAGLTTDHAFALHGTVATLAIAAVAMLWVKQARYELRAAALAAASLMGPPYLLSYDFVWLALPLLYLWKDGARHGWRHGDLPVMVAAWVSPAIFFLPAGWQAGNVMPVVMLALLAVIVRRTGVGGDVAVRSIAQENA